MLNFLSPLLILTLVLSAPALAKETPKKRLVKIGVTQAISHPAYDLDAKGFEKALAEAGFKEGVNVTYFRQIAQGRRSQVEKIAQDFVNGRVDLVHSIGTLASQAAVRRIKHIPIVFSSAPYPMESGLVPKSRSPNPKTGTNVTGVSDRWPVHLQFEMYLKFVPRARRWGTIYNPKDLNSIFHVREMRQSAKKFKVQLIEAMISNPSEAAEAAHFLAGKVQAIHLTYGSTYASILDPIVKVCNARKIPVFAGDVVSVSQGAVAAYGLDYSFVGQLAANRAIRILTGEKPGNIPWGNVPRFNLAVSERAAREQGFVIPPDFLKRADRVITE